MKDFENWLRKNTSLREGSIRLYGRTIQSYLNWRKTDSLPEMNEFISRSFRTANSFYVKYAFKHYLDWLGKSEEYARLVRVKLGPRKKLSKQYPSRTIQAIIDKVNNPRLADISRLQKATGARARGIITLKSENTDFEYGPNVIRLRLTEKGGKERVTFLGREFEPVLRRHYPGPTGYYFLPTECVHMSEHELEMRINTVRKYAYDALQKAARELGILHFGTHDFRRHVANELRQRYKDPYVAKKVLGHVRIETTLRYFDESAEDVQQAILGLQDSQRG